MIKILKKVKNNNSLSDQNCDALYKNCLGIDRLSLRDSSEFISAVRIKYSSVLANAHLSVINYHLIRTY